MKRYFNSLLALLMIGTFLLAATPSAFAIFGWGKGKKTGWEGKDTPPGLTKKDAEKTVDATEKKALQAKQAAARANQRAQQAARKKQLAAQRAANQAKANIKKAVS